jgi:hypothetical protein
VTAIARVRVRAKAKVRVRARVILKGMRAGVRVRVH